MKKILLTTTALVMTAGAAAAEVSVSGHAEMGIAGGTGVETQFLTSVDVRFTMTGETDGGLTFGATVDLDDTVDMGLAGYDPIDNMNGQFADYTVFVSGAFGTVTIGDTDGAMDWAMSDVGLGGTLGDDHTIHAGYNGNNMADWGVAGFDGQILRYDHSIGDFGFALSAQMDDSGVNDAVLGLGATYSADLGGAELGLGFGYQSGVFGTEDIWGVSADVTLSNGIRAIVNYSDLDAVGTHVGVGVAYSMDALTITANYGVFDRDTAGVADDEGYALVANYDLGGGAAVQFGYGSSKIDDGSGLATQAPSTDTWSLGVAMSF